MKRILFVTHHYLDGNGGGVFASRAFVNAFAEFADVVLLYPWKPGRDAVKISSSVIPVPVEYDKCKMSKALDIVSGHIHRYYDVFEKYLVLYACDTVIFDTCMVTAGLIGVAKKHEARVITIHHNFQKEYVKDNGYGFLKPFELHWIGRYEGEAVRESDLNLTLTTQDKVLLKNSYDISGKSHIEVSGVFAFDPEERLPEYSHPCKNRFVITGTLAAAQSNNSLIPWITDYFPILKEICPDASLVIAGRGPSNRLVELCRDNGITLVPSPKDMSSVLSDADYYICPTSLGGGLKLRILDGLKSGLPVLTHEVSARGYDVFVEKGDVFPYSDMESFRSALYAMMSSMREPRDIVSDYDSYFSFRAGVDRIGSILSDYGFK